MCVLCRGKTTRVHDDDNDSNNNNIIFIITIDIYLFLCFFLKERTVQLTAHCAVD